MERKIYAVELIPNPDLKIAGSVGSVGLLWQVEARSLKDAAMKATKMEMRLHPWIGFRGRGRAVDNTPMLSHYKAFKIYDDTGKCLASAMVRHVSYDEYQQNIINKMMLDEFVTG
jgi:hypothetical protein